MTPQENARSPWPACADCHVNAPSKPQGNTGSNATDAPSGKGDTACADIPLSQDLGPWASEVRRRAAETLARAIARAQDETISKENAAKGSEGPRRA